MTGFSLAGLTEGDPLLPNKLACTPPSPPSPPHIHISSLLCPKNVDFVIFMQFLAISSNSRHSLPHTNINPLGKPWMLVVIKGKQYQKFANSVAILFITIRKLRKDFAFSKNVLQTKSNLLFTKLQPVLSWPFLHITKLKIFAKC